ncbi:hypothetical protein AAHE18_12G084500 [Arachis hypogaea]
MIFGVLIMNIFVLVWKSQDELYPTLRKMVKFFMGIITRIEVKHVKGASNFKEFQRSLSFS